MAWIIILVGSAYRVRVADQEGISVNRGKTSPELFASTVKSTLMPLINLKGNVCEIAMSVTSKGDAKKWMLLHET